MARYYFIILSVFLVTSCAQVGTISGGEKDIIAPQIKKSSLKDKTVNWFSFNLIFWECLKLILRKRVLVFFYLEALD